MALILLIDDDEFYRRMIRRTLEENRHEVIDAEDGAVGLGLYKAYMPDLVITDMRMPEMDGGEVIRSIRAISPDIPIVAVSGASTFYNVSLLQLAKEVGANTALRKLDPSERVLVEVNRLLKMAQHPVAPVRRR